MIGVYNFNVSDKYLGKMVTVWLLDGNNYQHARLNIRVYLNTKLSTSNSMMEYTLAWISSWLMEEVF